MHSVSAVARVVATLRIRGTSRERSVQLSRCDDVAAEDVAADDVASDDVTDDVAAAAAATEAVSGSAARTDTPIAACGDGSK